ncbi:MAG: hypothetical protein KDE28_19785, partial [Anaerolineales bacterium]|nr:hypothetical protein [Anaerolineales bacterium]
MSIIEFQDDKPGEECGVFGIFAPGRDVARLTFFGLYALQHRGQESAGIVTSDGRAAYMHKGMGLVSQVFNEENLRPLTGHLAVGHNRYSTTGASAVRNAQPYLIETVYGPLAVAHNGNLTNALQLRHKLLQRGVGLSTTSDSEVITQMLAAPSQVWAAMPPLSLVNGLADSSFRTDGIRQRLKTLMHVAEGAYSLVVGTHQALYAARDPLGLRPLCLGKLPEGYAVASESCALLTIGAEFVREIEPGEIIKIDEQG